LEILVVTERHGHRFFVPDEDETFLISFIELVKERLENHWYEEPFKYQAQQLIQRYSIIWKYSSDEQEKLLKDVIEFLEKRRIFEWEDFEICQTEN